VKTKFITYVHEDSMADEIEENLSRFGGLENHPDLDQISEAIKNFTYEIEIEMEWDDETKQLSILGIK